MSKSKERYLQERSDAIAKRHSRLGVQQTTSHSRFDLGLGIEEEFVTLHVVLWML
jgi:hypothetical protein